jgi:hypothetical protein
MKNHFKKLRRLTQLSSTIAPLLIFIAFVCFAKGSLLLAAFPFIFGIALILSFPTDIMAPEPHGKSEWGHAIWIRMAVIWLIIFWVTNQPGAMDLVSYLFSSEALWDWRVILAAFLMSLGRSIANYRRAVDLDDIDIIAIYGDAPRNRIIQEGESGRSGD